jgi:phosphonatase-like hydrolase
LETVTVQFLDERPLDKENVMQLDMVMFDVAGTTVLDDDGVARAFRSALLDVGVSVAPNEIDAVMGLAKPVSLTALLSGRVPEDAVARTVSRAHEIFVDRMVHHYARSAQIRAIDGAESLFESLREEGICVALDTGFSRPFLDAILARLGWDEGLLDCTVASDEVAAGRPTPFMIARALELTGLGPRARVMKVGDTPADMQEGVAAGASAVVGVLSGTGTRAELEASGATHVLPSVAELGTVVFGRPRTQRCGGVAEMTPGVHRVAATGS